MNSIVENIKTTNDRIDELEAIMLENFRQVDCPLEHTFVPGMYIRKISMPAGTTITSQIHKTMHPFVVLEGKANVFIDGEGWKLIEAPYNGITMPNTRRVLRILEDSVWITYHPTEVQPENNSEEAVLKAVGLVGDQIIEPHENLLLGGQLKNNSVTKNIENEEPSY